MSPARKSASSRGTTRKRPTAREPVAIKRLNKALDGAQDALAALRKDVSKDVSVGARDLYKDLGKFVRDARRDSAKLGRALQRDIERLERRLSATPARSSSGARARRKTAGRSTARRTTSRGASRSRRR